MIMSPNHEHEKMIETDEKFGLLCYGVSGTIAGGTFATANIGDDIQSLAARQFLPRIDAFVNREYLRDFKSPNRLKMILNGWYCHNPKAWPPSEVIDPLLISLCVNSTDQKTVNSFLSKESRAFYQKNGPIGARDEATLKFFREAEIPVFHSGCLTLTLTADPRIPKQDYVLAVDLPEVAVEILRKQTSRPVYPIHPRLRPGLNEEDRRKSAETFLALYQSAHCVVTSRLHACLPSLALKTPVFLINTAKDQYRFSGLKNLAHHASLDDFIKNPSQYNVETPPQNPDDYLKIREDLIVRCETFCGVKKSDSFMARHAEVSNLDFLPVMMGVFSKIPDYPLYEYRRGELAKAFFKRLFAKLIH